MTSSYNLPHQLTTFVGRQQEIAEISELLASKRLVTVLGTGGSGKTRLALQLASVLIDRFEGVWFVELDTISNPSLVPQEVIGALGIREEIGPARDLVSAIASYLDGKHCLLVIDNCEHLVDACTALVDSLLRACPHLHIIATSRQALGVPGELTWPIPSLSLPQHEDAHVALEEVAQYDAVRLFVDRAAQSRPGFALTRENAEAIVQLCRQLDGLPLALELAAARVKVLSVEQIVQRLGERFRLLIGAGPTLQPRQQTLRALMDWSYELLTDAERALLRSLSVFAGSFGLEAVVSTCGGEIDEYELIELLGRLCDKSLMIMEERDQQARYRLLETIRQYAAEKLHDAGEFELVRGRHRDWYIALVEQAQDGLSGGEQAEWLNRLEMEHDNLRAALEWTIHGENNATTALLMAAQLWRFWDIHGYIGEGRKWLEDALASSEDAPPQVRARALSAAGNLAIDQGDYVAATRLHGETLRLRREIGDQRGIGASLSNLGVVARSQGDYDRAVQLYEESLAIFRELGSEASTAGVLSNLGFVVQGQGNYARAEQLFTEAMDLSHKIGDTLGVVISLNNLGEVAQARGDHARAREYYEQGLALDEELGDKLGMVGLLNNLASLAHTEGNQQKAAMLYRQSLLMSKDLGHLPGIAECLEGLAVAEAPLDYMRATRLFGAAMQLRDRIGAPVAPNEKAEYERQVEGLRSHLGPVFEAVIEAGKALTIDAAIKIAMETHPLAEASPEAGGAPSPEEEAAGLEGQKGEKNNLLTKREVEVLRLVAQGCTDAQVANTLSVSTRTVHAHLHSTYEKLEVTSRNAAVHRAAELGLL